MSLRTAWYREWVPRQPWLHRGKKKKRWQSFRRNQGNKKVYPGKGTTIKVIDFKKTRKRTAKNHTKQKSSGLVFCFVLFCKSGLQPSLSLREEKAKVKSKWQPGSTGSPSPAFRSLNLAERTPMSAILSAWWPSTGGKKKNQLCHSLMLARTTLLCIVLNFGRIVTIPVTTVMASRSKLTCFSRVFTVLPCWPKQWPISKDVYPSANLL